MMTSVLLADDHSLVRAGLRAILQDADLHVAAEAEDGNQTLQLLGKHEISVAVLDMSMPGRHGLDLIKEVRSRHPDVRILVLSMHGEDQYAVRAIRAGARGYLTKSSAPDQLVDAVRKVADGGVFVTPTVAERMAFELAEPTQGNIEQTLSDREYEIFLLLAKGLPLTEIASRLYVSAKTVSTHKARIMQKMGFDNVADLIRYALKEGITDAADTAN